MTAWQWFGIGVAALFVVGVYSLADPLAKRVMEVWVLMLSAVAVVLGVMSLIAGAWVPW